MDTMQFDTTRKQAPLALGDVLVLGLGKSGKAASSYCAALLGLRVSSLTVAAGADNAAAREFAAGLEAQGATVLFETYSFTGSYDLCIASPGISEFSDFYLDAKAHSAEVVSEVEFAWRESRKESQWVAVTGTNGKTTTTALCAHLLRAAGHRAVAVGNIGDTCLDAVAADAADCYVAEVSSYQLASTRDFAPDVAVLLNITPDHVKWHRSLEAYAQAKRKVLDRAGVAVMDAVNDVVRGYYKQLRDQGRGADLIALGTAQGTGRSMIETCGAENAAWLEGPRLKVEFRGVEHGLVSVDELQIAGEHNASNALAAASVAVALGDDDAEIREGLRTFAPLEHRIEPCGTVRGVRCYNDSKATNVDATLKALAAFGQDRPIVLLGGDDKGTDLSDLVSAAQEHCKAVVCFGAARERFLSAFEGSSCPSHAADHLADALDAALSLAQAGDIVILSPACASFDEFSCYEERGEVFKALVAERAEKKGV